MLVFLFIFVCVSFDALIMVEAWGEYKCAVNVRRTAPQTMEVGLIVTNL